MNIMIIMKITNSENILIIETVYVEISATSYFTNCRKTIVIYIVSNYYQEYQ